MGRAGWADLRRVARRSSGGLADTGGDRITALFGLGCGDAPFGLVGVSPLPRTENTGREMVFLGWGLGGLSVRCLCDSSVAVPSRPCTCQSGAPRRLGWWHGMDTVKHRDGA